MNSIHELRKFLSGNVIVEQKKAKKKFMKSGLNEDDKNIARTIGYELKKYVSQIERMLPAPWKLASPLALDKQTIEKKGSAYLSADLTADWEYNIAKDGSTVSSAYFIIEFYSYGGGAGVVCGVSVSGFDPCCRDIDLGVEMNPVPRDGEIDVSVEWKRKNKEFDVTKNVFPMIKSVMKEVKKLMPEYEEYYE